MVHSYSLELNRELHFRIEINRETFTASAGSEAANFAQSIENISL